MFSKVRKRLTYANMVMTLALVFAMSGGAYAAKHYLITSTGQISPKVLKHLVGKTGSNGKDGAAGRAGPAGTNGPQGPKGEPGSPGSPGAKGEKGEKGEKGNNGEPGQTGFTETLPKGKTETGTWAYRGSKENGAVGTEAVSFNIPLATEPQVEFVYAKKTGTNCTGNSAEPTAPEGFLCVYDAWEEEFGGKPITANYTGANNGEKFNGIGAGKDGALLNFETVHIGESVLPYAVAEGIWAVTAA
jgi:hypothetical protein